MCSCMRDAAAWFCDHVSEHVEARRYGVQVHTHKYTSRHAQTDGQTHTERKTHKQTYTHSKCKLSINPIIISWLLVDCMD